MRKPDFCLCENKGADQLRGNPEADHAFVFATRIVQFLFYLNPKLQASSSFLSLYRPICVVPGRKPRRPVFSRRGSNDTIQTLQIIIPFHFKKKIEITGALNSRYKSTLYEPRREKTGLRGFRPGPTQTGLYKLAISDLSRREIVLSV